MIKKNIDCKICCYEKKGSFRTVSALISMKKDLLICVSTLMYIWARVVLNAYWLVDALGRETG